MDPRRTGRRVALPLLALLAATRAGASQPCGPQTFLFDPGRTRADFTRLAGWVAEGVVVKRVEKTAPFPNCALEDRSRCARWDRSEVTVRVERWVKGTGPATLVLTSEWCAPDPPAGTGGRWRIYGRDGFRSFAMIERLDTPPSPAPAR